MFRALLLLTLATLFVACGSGQEGQPAANSSGTANTPVMVVNEKGVDTPSNASSSCAGGVPPGSATLDRPIVLAFVADITGGSSLVGELAQKAAELAVEKLNASGGVGGQPLQLVVVDAASTNQGALAAINEAADKHHADIIIGPVRSTQIQAVSERVKELGIPWLVGGNNPKLTQMGNEWIFRMRPDDTVTGTAMANFLIEKFNVSKVALLHDSDLFGTGGADIIQGVLEKAGKTVVLRDKYTTNTQDFTAQLLAVKNSGAEALALYGPNAADNAILLRQIKEQNLTIPVIGAPPFALTAVRDLAGPSMDGVYVAQDYFAGTTPEWEEYAKLWEAKYKTTPDQYSAWNWDAVHLAARAVAQGGSDKAKIRAAILATQGTQCIEGVWQFTPDGNSLFSMVIVQFKGQEPSFIRSVRVEQG